MILLNRSAVKIIGQISVHISVHIIQRRHLLNIERLENCIFE
jgi:hypothetical protein